MAEWPVRVVFAERVGVVIGYVHYSGLRGVPWAWEPEPCECACCVEAEGEDVYETCPPEEMVRKRDPAGVLLVASTSKAAHISETVWNGSGMVMSCLLYTSPSPRDRQKSRMPSSA